MIVPSRSFHLSSGLGAKKADWQKTILLPGSFFSSEAITWLNSVLLGNRNSGKKRIESTVFEKIFTAWLELWSEMVVNWGCYQGSGWCQLGNNAWDCVLFCIPVVRHLAASCERTFETRLLVSSIQDFVDASFAIIPEVAFLSILITLLVMS